MSPLPLRFLSSLLLLASCWVAAAPSTLGYQGRLATAGGTPVNATLAITFRLYDTPSGGVPLWTETQAGIDVDGGNFAVELGRVTSLPSTLWGKSLYLGVQIAGDSEMLPRPALTASPYALRAAGTMRRTRVVSAEGSPTENGAALLAAVAAITDASASSPVAIEIDAGTFDLGAARLHLPEYTSLIGRGQAATVITSNAVTASGAHLGTATVLLRSNTAIRDLTVRNTGIPVGANFSVAGIGAFDPDNFQQLLVNVQIDRVSGQSVAAAGSNGQRAGIVVCAANSRVTDVVGVAEGGQYGMALRCDCPLASNLVVDGADLYAALSSEGLRGAYLVAGFGNSYRRLRVSIDATPGLFSVYGLRFMPLTAFSTEPQGELVDSAIRIRGVGTATTTQTLQIDGVAVEDAAQLARIERTQVRMTAVRAARVTALGLRDTAVNSSKGLHLIDVDTMVSGFSDASVDGTAYGVHGVRINGYPPELIRPTMQVDCLAGSGGPCVGLMQNYYSWTPSQGEMLIDGGRVSVTHAGSGSSEQGVAFWMMGNTRIRNADLAARSASNQTTALAIHASSVVRMSGSQLSATNVSGAITHCVLAGPTGASGEWYGNHLEGARCDGGQVSLTCAGNTRRGAGFLGNSCP